MLYIVKEYLTVGDQSLFGKWFQGLWIWHLGNKIDFGRGYSVYYGIEGEEIVILITGG